MTNLHRTLVADAVARPKLRPYQQQVRDGVEQNWAAGVQNVLAILPTGGGKTVVFSSVLADEQAASVAVAHRQELVSQISLALARNRVRHRIIGPQNVVKMIVRLHMEEVGASYYDANSRCAVAGVDTLIRRGEQLANWLPTVKLWVMDECFAAGTIIDGKPISDIQVGDVVNAFNEKTRGFEQRKVVRLFKNPAPKHMVRVSTQAHHVLNCTLGHPFWTKRGWVDAGDLNTTDEVLVYEMSHVRKGSEPGLFTDGSVSEDWAGLLQQGVFEQVSCENIVGNDVSHESEIRLCANDVEQSYVEKRTSRENESYAGCHGTRSEGSRWERATTHESGTDAVLHVGVGGVRTAGHRDDRSNLALEGVSEPLQDRLCKSGTDDRNRGGRYESLVAGAAGTGCAQDRLSYWTRVDSVEVYESGDSEQYRDCAHDGYVYNFEVEGLHTYVANGVTVHNCHHVLRDNKWGKAVQMFPNARGLGVTATPCRADGNGLGRHADGVFDTMVIGPTMRDLIDAGNLTDYKLYAPPSNFDRSSLKTSESTGDFTASSLSKAVSTSNLVTHTDGKVVGNVVETYKKLLSGLLTIVFAPDSSVAKELEAQYNEQGIPAKYVWGNMHDDERQSALRDFKNRKIMVLINIALFDEGLDLPVLEAVQDVAATQSFGRFVQRVGRVLRLMPGKEFGRYVDHVGNIAQHCRVVQYAGGKTKIEVCHREWSLDRTERRSKSAPSETRTCTNPSCVLTYERFRTVCPYCGEPIPTPAASERTGVEFVDGDIFELDADAYGQLKASVERAAMSPEDYRDELTAKKCPQLGVMAHVKRHTEKLSTLGTLRDILALWGGYERAAGLSDKEIMRKFYLTYGVDLWTAQTLKQDEMLSLTERVQRSIPVPPVGAHG